MILLFSFLSYSQQEQKHQGPPKPPPVADRWKHDSTTIASSISLSTDQSKKTKTAYYNFYKEMDLLLEKNKGKKPLKEEVERLVKKRDDAVKAILNKEQSAKYEAISKKLMPPPPGHRKEPPPSKK